MNVNPIPNQLLLCYDAGCSIPVNSFTSNGPFKLTAPSGVILTASISPFSFNGLGQPSAAVTLSVNGSPITVSAETGYVQ